MSDKFIRVSRFVRDRRQARTIEDEWTDKHAGTGVVVSAMNINGQKLYRVIGRLELTEFAKWLRTETRRDIAEGVPWSVDGSEFAGGGS